MKTILTVPDKSHDYFGEVGLGNGQPDGRLSVAAAKALLCAVARKTAVFGGEALRGPLNLNSSLQGVRRN